MQRRLLAVSASMRVWANKKRVQLQQDEFMKQHHPCGLTQSPCAPLAMQGKKGTLRAARSLLYRHGVRVLRTTEFFQARHPLCCPWNACFLVLAAQQMCAL